MESQLASHTILIVEDRVCKIQLDRRIQRRKHDPQSITYTDIGMSKRISGIVCCTSDINKRCAADKPPDRMGKFSCEQIHEVTPKIVSVFVCGANAAVRETTDGVAAAKEITFVQRNISIGLVQHTNHTDFCTHGKDQHLVEEGYVGYGFSITNDVVGFMCNLVSEVLTIEDDLDKMEVIDEVMFNRTFDQMINNMRYRHMQEML